MTKTYWVWFRYHGEGKDVKRGVRLTADNRLMAVKEANRLAGGIIHVFDIEEEL